MKAMLLAAGLGSRLKPWTDHHPKALAPVNGKPLLQRNIEYLQTVGITEVVVNVHHYAQQIIDALTTHNGWGSTVTISNESDEVLETGGGLQKAAWFFNDAAPFLLMNADILTNLDIVAMQAAHAQAQPLATLAVTQRDTSRYFLFDAQQQLCGWQNVKTGEQKQPRPGDNLQQRAFSGIHIINPAIFSLIPFRGKFSMVDVYLHLCSQHTIKGFDHSDGLLLDVGKPDALELAARLFP
jgi:N-acetyl-alpha-D-muramate 1-phosphate uridylyltransferase